MLYSCCLMGWSFRWREGIFESQGTYGAEQTYFFVNILSGGGRDGGSGLWIVRCLVPGYVLVERQNIILVYSTHRSICGVEQRSWSSGKGGRPRCEIQHCIALVSCSALLHDPAIMLRRALRNQLPLAMRAGISYIVASLLRPTYFYKAQTPGHPIASIVLLKPQILSPLHAPYPVSAEEGTRRQLSPRPAETGDRTTPLSPSPRLPLPPQPSTSS